MAATITSSTSSGSASSGAKPPSSPSPVACPAAVRRLRSAAYTSAPARTASVTFGAPSGEIMNSWKSRAFGACAPPLRTLKHGTGIRGGCPKPGSHACRDCPLEAAKARARAIETPTVALAPRRALVGVPSAATIASSTEASDAHCRPRSRSAISPLTLPTAVSTPPPPKRAVSPSRSSTASRVPVEAPDGTPATAVVPSASVSVVCRVGRPRESRISRAETPVISKLILSQPFFGVSSTLCLGVGVRFVGSQWWSLLRHVFGSWGGGPWSLTGWTQPGRGGDRQDHPGRGVQEGDSPGEHRPEDPCLLYTSDAADE